MDKDNLKIGIYVLNKYAKQTYNKECYNVRLNAGMAVVCDILKRAGFTNIDYCSAATAHKFDMVMYSVTSDCDWWEFIAERVASAKVKQATLEKYFDVDNLFGEFTPDTLPTRNIRTYCKVEKMW